MNRVQRSIRIKARRRGGVRGNKERASRIGKKEKEVEDRELDFTG